MLEACVHHRATEAKQRSPEERPSMSLLIGFPYIKLSPSSALISQSIFVACSARKSVANISCTFPLAVASRWHTTHRARLTNFTHRTPHTPHSTQCRPHNWHTTHSTPCTPPTTHNRHCIPHTTHCAPRTQCSPHI